MSFTSVESRWPDVWLAATAEASRSAATSSPPPRWRWPCRPAGAGGLAVSGLLIAATLPLVLLAPLAGRLADRVDSRTLLVDHRASPRPPSARSSPSPSTRSWWSGSSPCWPAGSR